MGSGRVRGCGRQQDTGNVVATETKDPDALINPERALLNFGLLLPSRTISRVVRIWRHPGRIRDTLSAPSRDFSGRLFTCVHYIQQKDRVTCHTPFFSDQTNLP